MKDLTTTSSDLFNKIRSRFSKIKIGDAEGIVTTDPAQARFFDFDYTVDNHNLGRVNIKIDNQSLIVIYNADMLKGHTDDVANNWYGFLKEIRQFARSNLLTFDTRDITKTNLDKRDYAFLSQNTGDPTMSESKLFGSSRTSYQDIGEAKIIVKHSRPVNYNLPAGRTQHIESIYIESAQGERFRYPFKHLNGARAMAVHVANGGTVYDAIGTHISGLSEELSKLRQFKNYTNRTGVMAEALGDITEKVAQRVQDVKEEISRLQRQQYYVQFKESFSPTTRKEVPEETINQWVDALTIKTFNEELKSVFPYIYNLVNEKADLTYDDLVSEITEPDEEDEDDIESDVREHSLFDEFTSSIDEVSQLQYQQEAAEYCPCDDAFEETCNCENCELSDTCERSTVTQNQTDPENTAAGSQNRISNEVVEFIQSMYDSNTRSFPRGEEGVKIAVEKKFGEDAGRFAHFVVEKLSGTQSAQTEENDKVEDEPQFDTPEMEDLKRLAGI